MITWHLFISSCVTLIYISLMQSQNLYTTIICLMCISHNISRSSIKRLLKIPKTNLKTFGECSFGYIALSVWNSLPADLRASPSLPTFKVNLKTHVFRQAFWLICTCQPLPVSYLCECECVCVCVCERELGWGWGLGGMELRVGSNIMIHFLYILLLLIWHMYLYINYYTLLVVIIICIMFVELRKCWRML